MCIIFIHYTQCSVSMRSDLAMSTLNATVLLSITITTYYKPQYPEHVTYGGQALQYGYK